MLRIEGINKYYEKKHALSSISLSVKTGHIHGLVGKNGAGKTTLLHSILGIYKLNSGSITWHNTTVYENTRTKQKLYLIPDRLQFPAFETIRSLAKQHSHLYPNWSETRYQSLMKSFEMDDSKSLRRLSKGEQRQIIFCMALAVQPELLVLDEPFDGLDPIAKHKIKNLLFSDVADRHMTVLVSSHDLNTLEDICDSISLIQDGVIRFTSDLDLLKTNIHKVQIAFSTPHTNMFDTLDILHQEQRGNLYILIVKSLETDLLEQLERLEPAFLELLPLSLNELFLYEMEGLGHEYQTSPL